MLLLAMELFARRATKLLRSESKNLSEIGVFPLTPVSSTSKSTSPPLNLILPVAASSFSISRLGLVPPRVLLAVGAIVRSPNGAIVRWLVAPEVVFIEAVVLPRVTVAFFRNAVPDVAPRYREVAAPKAFTMVAVELNTF